MFDLGFSELIVVFVIALVVLGPTRLPQLAAKVGRWIGKARSMARQFREQLESEVQLEELNRMTEKRTGEPMPSTPPPPPGMSGEPLPETPAPAADYAHSGYPYGPQELPPEAPAAEGSPQPGDDTYSHAHAMGDAPMPYNPENEQFAPAAPEVVLEPAPAPAPALDPALDLASDSPPVRSPT
jgi:sec-independent protein translocase protein TatB